MVEAEKSQQSREKLEEEIMHLKGELSVAETAFSVEKKIREKREQEILEYQYRTGEKQRPLTEKTLSDYVNGVRARELIGKKYIISDARLNGSKRKIELVTLAMNIICPLFIPVSGDVLRYLDIELGNNNAVCRFSHYGTSRNLDAVEEILSASEGKNFKAIVDSTTSRRYFIIGVVQEDDKYQLFDRL